MAIRQSGFVQRLMEKIVSRPPLATLTVGFSILILLQIIQRLSLLWPETAYLKFLVPFIPPFFITRTAKRINQRRAEYDFIRDAEPYIFVAFPKAPSVESLLETPASMFSDSAVRHFNCSIDEIMASTALPVSFVTREDREAIAIRLVEDFQKNDGRGTLRNYRILMTPQGKSEPEPFVVNSVLKTTNGRLKWQATLTKLDAFPEKKAE